MSNKYMLTTWKHSNLKWGGRWDSNPRQPVPQTGALPTELRPPYYELNFNLLKNNWSG